MNCCCYSLLRLLLHAPPLHNVDYYLLLLFCPHYELLLLDPKDDGQFGFLLLKELVGFLCRHLDLGGLFELSLTSHRPYYPDLCHIRE